METWQQINRVVDRLSPGRLHETSVEGKVLTGGTDAFAVALVTIRCRDHLNRPKMLRFVAKQLTGRATREAAVYAELVAVYASDMSPRVLAVDRAEPDTVLLVIEAIRKVRCWPWRDLSLASELLERLAKFHLAAAGAAATIPEWDYEAELGAIAEVTRNAVEQCRCYPDLSVLARNLRPLDRIVLARSDLRRQLLAERPFGHRPIHGDAHPGNVLVRRRGRGDEPVLIDWGRARVGSPLEDVSSWLQSLRCWEVEAQRSHDTLLTSYLSAFGMERRLTSQIRAAYWMASASNALAGALLYHLRAAGDQRQSAARRMAAFTAARDWLRIVRRADAWWS
jgi:hypothetical protein